MSPGSAYTSAAFILLFAGLIGCRALADESEASRFARAPRLALTTLSPDGRHLSYVEQTGSMQHTVIRSLASGAATRVLSLESERERIRWCGWVGVRHVLCGSVSPVRRRNRVFERTRLYGIDAGAQTVHELNVRLQDPVRDQVIDFVASRPAHALLQHDPLGRGYPEVVELNAASGALRVIERAHPPVRRWMSDGRGRVRLGISYDGGIAGLHRRRPGTDDWELYHEQSLTDPDALGPLAFGQHSSELLVLKHHQGRAALFRINVDRQPPDPILLFADPAYDVAGPLVQDPSTRALLAVRYVAEVERSHFFDSAEAARQAWIDEQLPDAVNSVIDRSHDGNRLLVQSASDVDPPSLYLAELSPQRLTMLAHLYPELETRKLAATQPMTYRARDGQRIPAYLTLPARARSLPAVILPHGGPEARDSKSFNPLVQFLASQGYAVMQMNFRGSLGYGAGFAAAGAGQWGGVIHNDITDATRWLVEQGIADPTRICIVGMSFGGYAALLGAVRESEWYACAVSFAGATDLMALAQHAQRLPGAHIWKERLGGSQRGLWEMSPLSNVRTMETPVLLMHGPNDPVVPISQARRFARAMNEAAKPHLLIERADCDHEMSVESCRVAFYTELARFLRERLVATE
jgi:dipeptidyl aminopeptidase/acylaminoacyl peptidase